MPTAMLERFFRVSENQTSARMELLAGVTTFLTMACIIFVQLADQGLIDAVNMRPTVLLA